MNTEIEPFAKKLSLLVILVPIIMLCVFFFSVIYYGTPEFRVDKTQHGLKISKVNQPLNPVKKDDLIIGIDAMAYHQVLSCFIFSGWKADLPTRIRIQRGSDVLEISPMFNPVTPFQFLSVSWPHLLLMFTMIFMGVLAFFRRVATQQPVALFLITLCLFATTFTATIPSYFGILAAPVVSLSFFTLAVCNWLAFSCFLHFVFSFPKERSLTHHKSVFLFLIYLAPPLISIFCAVLLADHSDAFWTWLQRVRNIALPFMAVIAFIKHFVDFRALSSTLEKNQVKLIISAYWLSFGPYMILYAIPNMFLNHPLISFRLVVLSCIVLPGAYFFSLIQYRLLDVDKLVSRTATYMLLIAVSSISYSFFMAFLEKTFVGRGVFAEELFLIYIIAIALLFGPLTRAISWILDQVFLPGALYREELIPALTRELGATIHFQDLIRILTRQIPEQFHIQHVQLVVCNASGTRFYPDMAQLNAMDLTFDALKKQLSETSDFLFFSQAIEMPELAAEVSVFQSHDPELIFALRGGVGLSGFLLLGRRKDGRPYTRRDTRFFSTISSQVGLALENSLHYESLLESKQQVEKMFSKVVQSEKMAALGEMSTVLAHEIKNPLSIIRSSAQYLKRNQGDINAGTELFDFIIGEVDHLESVVNNMMGLAKYQAPSLEKIDLKIVATELISHWTQSGNHSRNIAIHLDCDRDLPLISADSRQLQQVFLNCIINSEDAMPEGGEIDISISATEKATLSIQICDTGSGIDAADLDNAFRQFFTTKEKGMGIGLSVCRQIVQDHHGTICLENRPAGGLCVLISLPVDPMTVLEPGKEALHAGSNIDH